MEINVVRPKLVDSWSLPMKELRILPIGDIQYGAQGCDLDKLQRHLKWGIENDCYFVGLGDYLDVASPTNRTRLLKARLENYDSVNEAFTRMMEQLTGELMEVLEGTRGRWLGLVQGHHWWPFPDGSTTDTRLAKFLGCDYMGDGVGLTMLPMTLRGHRERYRGTARLWYTHGEGGGTTPGAPLNRLAGVAQTVGANAYLMGHIPRKASTKIPYLDYEVGEKGEIMDHTVNRVLAVCGGFMKGYMVGTKDEIGSPTAIYSEAGMLPPTTIGGNLIFLRPKMVRGRVLVDADIQI